MENKIHFVSLGCPRNRVDSEVMLGLLLQAGYEVTPYTEEADYLVVNTCGFLEASREESKATVAELFAKKKASGKVIVAGCMVSKHREEIEQAFPQVHYLLGSGDVEGILEAVRSDLKGAAIGSARSYLEQGEVPRTLSTPSHYAYLKIAEGCRKACAYCKIPSIKGPLRSKSLSQVLRELEALLAQGVKEIILIAQDLGDFGKDWKDEKERAKTGALKELLRSCLQKQGNFWLRLLYLYPDEIDEEMIALMRSDSRLVPYLDMPIQHINDKILKAMRRTTNSRQIKAVIQALRKALPEIHIRTSLIVGFPGETEADFEELVQFLQDYPLNHVGIFKYSREPGTPAAEMAEQVPEEIKQQRFERLAALQQQMVVQLNQALVGRQIDVVVEGYHPESQLLLVGRHAGQCPDIDSQVILNDWGAVRSFGERYLVEITAVAGYDLVGRVVKREKVPSKKRTPLVMAQQGESHCL